MATPPLSRTDADPARAAARAAVGRRNTAVLVGFTIATNVADGVMKMVLPFIAAHLTSSPVQVAAVSMMLMLPWLLVALHIGVLVDRFDRRRLLWVANGMRLVAIGWLTISALDGGLALPELFVAGPIIGVADVLATTAAVALVPAAVPPAERERANAWMLGAETIGMEFAGPFIGGLLLAVGAGLALGATATAYVVAALILLLLVGRFRAAGAAPGTPHVPVGSRIAEGLRFIWRNRVLRTLMLIVALLNATWSAWMALLPLYARETMALGPQQYGIALSALGIGGLTGALAVTWVNRLLGPRMTMFADLVATTVMVAMPALTTNIWAVAAGAFLGGMGGILWSVNSRTLSQRLVPDDMLGRFNATFRFFGFGAMPLGAGVVGLLAEVVGTRLAFGVFALATTATVVPFLRNITRSALQPR